MVLLRCTSSTTHVRKASMVRSCRSSEIRTSSSVAPRVNVCTLISSRLPFFCVRVPCLEDKDHAGKNSEKCPYWTMLQMIARYEALQHSLQNLARRINYFLNVLFIDAVQFHKHTQGINRRWIARPRSVCGVVVHRSPTLNDGLQCEAVDVDTWNYQPGSSKANGTTYGYIHIQLSKSAAFAVVLHSLVKHTYSHSWKNSHGALSSRLLKSLRAGLNSAIRCLYIPVLINSDVCSLEANRR